MSRHRVAIVVFAEVDDAINERDAGNVVVGLLQDHLPTGTNELTRDDHTWGVTISTYLTADHAATSGYLALTPTNRAYQ